MKMRIIICISNDNNSWINYLSKCLDKLYFSINLSVGSESLSAKGLVLLNLGILRSLTVFEKNIYLRALHFVHLA